MNEYFPDRKSLRGRVKVELYLFNYAAKTDLEKGKELIHHLLLKKMIQQI